MALLSESQSLEPEQPPQLSDGGTHGTSYSLDASMMPIL